MGSELIAKEFSWRNLALFLLTITAVFVCALMVQPFLPAVVGALVLAVVTQRPHRWIEAKLRRPNLAASISVMLVSLSIILPTLFFAQILAGHILAGIAAVQSGAAQRGIQQFLADSPRISTILQFSIDNITLEQAFNKSVGFIAARLTIFLGGSIAALTQIVIMLFLLFFLYRDRSLGLSYLRSIVPLRDYDTDYLLGRIGDTIQATVLGHFLVSGIQGIVAGITFALLGVSGASLLGLATAVCAIVPSFGAFVVWVPVAVYLAATHHWMQAVLLMAVGTILISTLDNILYPVLVGAQLRLHTAPVLISLLGGILVFGISGLILGPIAFTLVATLLSIWKSRIPNGAIEPDSYGASSQTTTDLE
ncbi:MAG: AI-2E family transporter [Acidobacteriaceae bacterium]